ncbi:hypothetical protein BDZ97DRAFT_1920156 [Flammula alnicola]|nr:hypothetical protein BDZ97DRAFT_1920156 [Flammula alnicola]
MDGEVTVDQLINWFENNHPMNPIDGIVNLLNNPNNAATPPPAAAATGGGGAGTPPNHDHPAPANVNANANANATAPLQLPRYATDFSRAGGAAAPTNGNGPATTPAATPQMQMQIPMLLPPQAAANADANANANVNANNATTTAAGLAPAPAPGDYLSALFGEMRIADEPRCLFDYLVDYLFVSMQVPPTPMSLLERRMLTNNPLLKACHPANLPGFTLPMGLLPPNGRHDVVRVTMDMFFDGLGPFGPLPLPVPQAAGPAPGGQPPRQMLLVHRGRARNGHGGGYFDDDGGG